MIQTPLYFGLTQEHTWILISERIYDELIDNSRMKLYKESPEQVIKDITKWATTEIDAYADINKNSIDSIDDAICFGRKEAANSILIKLKGVLGN